VRETEIPYVAATEAVNAYLDGGDPKAVIEGVPEHLRDLVRHSARSQVEMIRHWAKRYRQGAAVPKAYVNQVKRYLESRK
jgi:hypothetical protein